MKLLFRVAFVSLHNLFWFAHLERPKHRYELPTTVQPTSPLEHITILIDQNTHRRMVKCPLGIVLCHQHGPLDATRN